MTLAEAVAEFETLFESVMMGEPSQFADTGEEYVVVTHAGLKPEAARVGWLATDEGKAIDSWLEMVTAYAATAGGSHLYWREKPQIWKHGGKMRATFGVYSRLVVSKVALVGTAA